tara:strand:- start:48 stop:1046 length:999 start_codon:yes stop_codon:yes gene_type:complete
MSTNILVFRTDRVGDLLLTCPAFLSIKKNFPNSKITLIASNKNFKYAKTFDFFDDVLIFPEKNFFKKISFIKKLSKNNFDLVLIFDGKERSFFTSMFLKSNKKFGVLQNKKINFFWKLLNIKFVLDDEKTNLIDIYQKLFDLAQINTNIKYYNFLTLKEDNQFSSKINCEKYIQIHLDEKWSNKLYINKYKEINPSYKEFTNLLLNLSENYNILITTGILNYELVDLLISNFFKKDNNNIYFSDISKNKIFLIYKPSLLDLESLIKKAKILISCHGAIVHMANSFNVKIFDIIDQNKKDWYLRFTSYLKNHNLIYRDNFNLIAKQLVNNLKL